MNVQIIIYEICIVDGSLDPIIWNQLHLLLCDQQSRTEQCTLGNHAKFYNNYTSCNFSTVKISTHAHFLKKNNNKILKAKCIILLLKQRQNKQYNIIQYFIFYNLLNNTNKIFL